MGGRNYCSIPGCRSNRKYFPSRAEAVNVKNITLFSVPKDEERLEKWREILKLDELTVTHKICELHFNEDDIIRYYQTVLPNGTIWKMDRDRVVLKKEAVPTLFPTLQNSPRKRKSENILNSSTISIKKKKTYLKENFSDSESTIDDHSKCSAVIINDDNKINVERIENYEPTNAVLNEKTETFTYSTLVNNVELVSKPNSLWGIAVHDDFVMCAKWNEDSTLLKRVVIDCNLKIQVFLKNRAIDFEDVQISSINDLSSILLEIDKYGICIHVNDIERTECDGYILSNSCSNQCEYCLLIGNWEIKKSKKLYWLSKRRHFIKHEALYEKIHALNKKNALLKEQLSKIIKIKAVWKLSNQTSAKKRYSNCTEKG